jgi:hypothetical protein
MQGDEGRCNRTTDDDSANAAATKASTRQIPRSTAMVSHRNERD